MLDSISWLENDTFTCCVLDFIIILTEMPIKLPPGNDVADNKPGRPEPPFPKLKPTIGMTYELLNLHHICKQVV